MKPSPATVIASIALFVAVGGPAEAARFINGSKIKRGTITAKQVKDRSLGVRELSTSARRSLTRTPARSVGTAQLLEGAVGPAQIRPGSITAAALAADAVGSANIIDRQVGNADLGDSSVSAAKLQTGSVRKSEIAGGAVGTSELANAAVTGEKLADGSVTAGKLAPDAVTGATVADGSLTAADYADAGGTVQLSIAPLAANSCSSASVAVPGARSALDDDVILATPPAAWSDRLTLLARPESATTIRLSVCNVGTTGQLSVPTGPVRVLALNP